MSRSRVTWFLLIGWLWASGGVSVAVPGVESEGNPHLGIQYGHAQWDLMKGLPSNWITAVRQDRASGLIWLATPEALARFDGERFETYGATEYPGLTGGAWALEMDGSGDLWVGTRSHGLLHWHRDTFVRFGKAEGLGDEEVRALHFDGEGRLWIGTASGLFVKENEAIRVAFPEVFENRVITCIATSESGELWVGTQDDGLFTCEADTMRPVVLGVDRDIGTIQAIYPDGADSLWVGGKHGLVRVNGGTALLLTDTHGLPSNSVRSLLRTRDGTLWVGTEMGLARVVGDRVVWNQSSNPFSVAFITSLHEDAEGSLWVGSKFDGLGQFWRGKFQVFDREFGIKNDVVNVVIEDEDDGYLIGTHRGLYRLSPEGIEPVHEEVLGELRIRDLQYDRRGILWVATYSGLFRLENGIWDRLDAGNGLNSDLVRQVFEDREGRIWVGTRSGLHRLDREGIVSWGRPELPNDLIMDIRQTADGTIWVATDGAGVGRYINGQFAWVGPGQGLGSGVVFDIYESDDRSTVWFATTGGLSYLREGKWGTIGQRQGLPNETIFQVMEDADGNLWYTAHEGIYRMLRSEVEACIRGQQAQIAVHRYGPKDGLKTYQMTGVGKSLRDRCGRFLFASTRGVAVIQPRSHAVNMRVPKVHIREFLADQVMVAYGWNMRVLAPGVKRVEISYSSDSLVGATENRYAWRLLGFEDEWVRSQDNRAVFTNLGAGSYRFQLLSSNADGVWSEEPAEFVFEIKPRLSETLGFRIVAVMILATGVFSIFWWRVVIMRAEARRLESLVEQRTSELRKQKEHLEYSQRFIEKSNQELKKLNESQRYMLGVAAHDMKNPLGNIRMLSKELRNELHSELRENHPGIDSLRLIEQSSSDLLDLVEGVVQSSTLDASDMNLSYEQENLAELLRSVIETNQYGARQKGQNIRFDTIGDLIASADALQMRSAMDNLLSNAIKYSPEKSMIDVELKAVAAARIRMTVKDEGPGLTDEDMTRVFGKFARLSARPTAGESSAGMGLAIVKQVITLHGGEVGVQNRTEGGAEFWFEIPMMQEDQGRAACP